MHINFARSLGLLGVVNRESVDAIFKGAAGLIGKDPSAEVFLLINSGGGSVDAGNMVIDLLPKLCPNLVTVGSGMVGSMAIPIFLSGGKRYITRHTRFFFHEVGNNYKDTRLGVGEVESDLKDLEALQHWYIEYVVERTEGKLSEKRLRRMMRSETTLYPKDMKGLGLFDKVIK